jgi:hypothetical protein
MNTADTGLPDSLLVCTLAPMRGHLCAGRACLWLGGLAAFGIVAAHCLAYVVTAQNMAEMSLLMDATGHRYWGLAVGVALGAAIGGAAGFYVRILRVPRAGLGRMDMFLFLAPRLGALQLAGFVLLEVSERVLWGSGLAHPLEEPVVIAGLALQLIVAVASALLLTVAAGLAVLIAKYFRRIAGAPRAPRALNVIGARALCSPQVLLLAGGAGARGPPAAGWGFAFGGISAS